VGALGAFVNHGGQGVSHSCVSCASVSLAWASAAPTIGSGIADMASPEVVLSTWNRVSHNSVNHFEYDI
jgi:hypothetical protein